jgi:hypothetical protein
MNPEAVNRDMSVERGPSEEQKKALQMLSQLTQAANERSVLKHLQEIGVDVRFGDVTVDDKLQRCMVIPLQELVEKEWQHLNQNNQR